MGCLKPIAKLLPRKSLPISAFPGNETVFSAPMGKERTMASSPGKALHVELTRSILDSAIRVQNALGVGLYEKPYKVCLAHSLRQKGHQVPTYLRLSCNEVGLLLNFWASPLKDGGIQRLIRPQGGRAGNSVP